MPLRVRIFLFFLSSLAAFIAGSASAQTVDWPVYHGGPDGDHYSPLTQINRQNVQNLRVAWTYDTGEKGNLETSPIIVGHTLYAYTVSQKVIALDAATGQLKWKFDSGIHGTQPVRGVVYWTDGRQGRILAGIMNYLYCLDADTGRPIASFGDHGRIDLRKNLRGDFKAQSTVLTSPGILYKDLIIVGGRDPETHPAPPGDIRAFDVRTGQLRWRFRTIPRPGQPGYKTWPPGAWRTAGAANNWAGMALDAKRGIVYVPTGSAVFDFYGGDRVGNDLYADTLLALDANTGRRLWHFQGVHHDIWDRDFPAPPALFSLVRNGKRIDAIAQTTKQGYVYVFDRTSGQPLFPVREHPFPSSDVPGEVTSPTQPMPDLPEPFGRQRLTADMLTNRTPQAHDWAVKAFSQVRSDGQFVPFSVGKQTIVFPGFDGGAEWGGPALDPATNVLYVNANEMAWLGGLVPTPHAASPGQQIYSKQCAACHGVDRAGSPPAFPSLVHIGQRLSTAKITDAILHGKGRMPGFPNIQGADLQALLEYLRNPSAAPGQQQGKELASSRSGAVPAADTQDRYTFTGYRKFLDPDGYPAIAPPWGTLSAIDLNTGQYLWKTPLGEYPELARQGMTNTGSENYGGPVVTAGGVLFIGATVYDRKFRAFDSATGKLLWETELPSSGMATPATYMVDSRQYVVIAASGGRDPKRPVGGDYVAFALPK